MRRHLWLIMAGVACILLLIGSPGEAYAYIDPGTASVIFSALAPILAGLAAVFGFLLLPFRKLIGRLKSMPAGRRRVVAGASLAVVGLTVGGLVWYLSSGAPVERRAAMTEARARSVRRAVLIGMDGLDAHLMERMLASGELPNFKRLEFDFIRRNPKNYLPDLAILQVKSSALSMGGTSFTPVLNGVPFWTIANAAGIPSTVVRWPITFPPEDGATRMLSGLGVPDLRGNLGNYAYYTTVPSPSEDEGADKVITVDADGGVIKTSVFGPQVQSLKGRKAAEVPLTIELNGDEGTAKLSVEGAVLTLKEGEWSEWARVRFKTGLMQKVTGMVRFYLKEANPAFGLYMSPIHIDPREPAFPITHPEGYAKELSEAIGLYHTLGMPEDTKGLSEGRLDEEAYLELCDQVMKEREAMLWYELDRLDKGVLAFVFDTTDRIQHMFWRYEDKDHPAFDAGESARFGSIVESYYRRMDVILGKLFGRLEDETLVIVFSDHGFNTFRRAVHLNTWLAQQGWMALSPPEQGKDPEGPLFSRVDWSATKAYALGFNSIYLNLKGREGKGVLEPGEVESLKEKLARGLMELTDPETGQPVVRRVYTNEELYRGPRAQEGPDLVVGFKPGYRASWQTAIGGAPKGLFIDNEKKWSGDHLIDPSYVPGILFMNRPIQSERPRLVDLAPTVLEALGLEKPREMEGQSFLALH
jgi:predicted AlkP superfamily phosphohydrolase/phosphomutase